MAEYQNLQATINAVIKANGVQAITGPVLNAVLNSMVTVLGDGYRFGGVAAPADNPGSPDNRVAYLAAQDGTYTNFGGLALSGEVALLCWDAAWTKQTLFTIDAAPTPGSDNLISSGAVDTALTNLANSIAAAYMQLVPSAVEDHLASYDNAGQVKDSGLAAGDVVLKGGAYLGLFAGYAANLVDTRSAGTPQGPYAFRQSGGDGVDYMVRIKGKTEAWNQLINGAPSLVQGSGITMTDNGDGSYTFNGTASGQVRFGYNFATTSGHTLLVMVSGNLNGSVSTYFINFSTPAASSFYTPGANVVTAASTLNFQLLIQDTVAVSSLRLSFQVIDLTLQGLGLTTAAAFQSLHPLPYYNYNAGVLKNNAATGIKTRGFNQWDEQWEIGTWVSGTLTSKNLIPIVSGQSYYFAYTGSNSSITGMWVRYYDASQQPLPGYGGSDGVRENINTPVTPPFGAAYMKFRMQPAYGATYNHDICINLSDASRNGDYESYWEREVALGLNSLACHDENNNAVTLNGLDGVGTSYDEAVVENGMVTKIIKRRGRINLGDQTWTYGAVDSSHPYGYFSTPLADNMKANSILHICTKYSDHGITFLNDKNEFAGSYTIFVVDSAYTDAATFKTAMNGVYLDYELATPKVLTVDTPFPAFVEVDNLGTQERLPADTAADPQGGFESDSNYSVSTANLVRALGL